MDPAWERNLNQTRSWLEIDTAALLHNHGQTAALLPPGTDVMAVVKADAYGHGAVQVAALLADRVACFGVASAWEAVELRKSGIENDILILSGSERAWFPLLAEYDIMPSIFDFESARALSDAAVSRTASCFIAIDTGMTRIGFPDSADGLAAIRRVKALPRLSVRGIFSHFARADETDKTSALDQLTRFRRFTDLLEREGLSCGLRCLCNSAGLMELDGASFDMVREGIVLYGVYPSDEVDRSRMALKPVLSMKTRVSLVKTVPAGVGVSYGHRFTTSRETRIATLCAGYADGVPRLLSNRGSVLLHGRRAPILGRVCMDQMMVDVTDIPEAAAGDIATVIGRDGEAEISAEEVAALAQTIPYEILCGFSRLRLPRIYR